MSTSKQAMRTRAAAATLVGLLGVGGVNAATASAATDSPSTSGVATEEGARRSR